MHHKLNLVYFLFYFILFYFILFLFYFNFNLIYFLFFIFLPKRKFPTPNPTNATAIFTKDLFNSSPVCVNRISKSFPKTIENPFFFNLICGFGSNKKEKVESKLLTNIKLNFSYLETLIHSPLKKWFQRPLMGFYFYFFF